MMILSRVAVDPSPRLLLLVDVAEPLLVFALSWTGCSFKTGPLELVSKSVLSDERQQRPNCARKGSRTKHRRPQARRRLGSSVGEARYEKAEGKKN